jgi:propanediol dehydratase large subunit
MGRNALQRLHDAAERVAQRTDEEWREGQVARFALDGAICVVVGFGVSSTNVGFQPIMTRGALYDHHFAA